ncbi:MAG: 23S rRNA pseudouridylate synthase B, partial [Ottowia sp.]
AGGAPRGEAPPPEQRRRGPARKAGQPDPLKTSQGYIGADSFARQRAAPKGKPNARPGGKRGGGPRR